MKKRMKVSTQRTKKREIQRKSAKAGTPLEIKPPERRKPAYFTDAKGLRHPIYVGVDLARGPDVSIEGEQFGFGDYPRPAPSSSIKCGECRHAEECGALKICRSFLSPRAGFAHVAKYNCGYGRAIEVAA